MSTGWWVTLWTMSTGRQTLGGSVDEQTHSYPSTVVCQTTGLTYRVLDYWARNGVLVPSVAVPRGTGYARRYSRQDINVARVLNVLRQIGAQTDVLRAVGRNLAGLDLDGGTLAVSPAGDVSVEDDPPWACWWSVRLDEGDSSAS